MTIEWTLPKGAPSLHNNEKFKALPHAARLRVLAQWVEYWSGKL